LTSYLICGLGNPGKKYELTKHNIGFLVLDQLADKFEIPVEQKKFKSLFGQLELDKNKIYLLKPQTYMNLSGEAIKEAASFFKIEPQNLLIIHDDLDFPFGTVRIKIGGGAGGHNGLSSIIEHLGTDEFTRIRIGIGRPSTPMDPAGYVLQPYTEEQNKKLEDIIAKGLEAIGAILKSNAPSAMNKFNQRSNMQ
jgi:peptidyl-tRNA hydrolase, PTH1 family